MGKRPRKRMTMEQRAAQFLPFQAVKGLKEALKRKEYEMGLVEKVEYFEEVESDINNVLTQIKVGDLVRFECFVYDKKLKDVGSYIPMEGRITKINISLGWYEMDDTYRIPITDIVGAEILAGDG